jgi:ligand-binding sensor domain-containing protein
LGVKKGGIYHFAGADWQAHRLDNAAWERYSSQVDPDFSENVEPVAAPDGSVWVADNYNLWHFEDDQWTVQREPAGARIMFTSAPAFAPDGSMWIGTMRSGVFNFDGKRWQQYTRKDGLVSNDWVSEVAVTGEGTAWFGTTSLIKEKIGGLSRFDGQRWDTYPWTWNGSIGSVLAADPDGGVWVGTAEGLSHYVDGAWVNYTDLDGLPDNGIHSLAVSPEGILWVGCSTGLARFEGKRWQTYTFSMYDGSLVGSITALAVEENGAVWAAVYPFGVRRFDGQQWAVYTSRDGLGDDAVRHIAVASDGSVWFAAAGGLSRYKPAVP